MELQELWEAKSPVNFATGASSGYNWITPPNTFVADVSSTTNPLIPAAAWFRIPVGNHKRLRIAGSFRVTAESLGATQLFGLFALPIGAVDSKKPAALEADGTIDAILAKVGTKSLLGLATLLKDKLTVSRVHVFQTVSPNRNIIHDNQDDIFSDNPVVGDEKQWWFDVGVPPVERPEGVTSFVRQVGVGTATPVAAGIPVIVHGVSLVMATGVASRGEVRAGGAAAGTGFEIGTDSAIGAPISHTFTTPLYLDGLTIQVVAGGTLYVQYSVLAANQLHPRVVTPVVDASGPLGSVEGFSNVWLAMFVTNYIGAGFTPANLSFTGRIVALKGS